MSDFVVYEWMLGRELDLGKCELVILGLEYCAITNLNDKVNFSLFLAIEVTPEQTAAVTAG